MTGGEEDREAYDEDQASHNPALASRIGIEALGAVNLAYDIVAFQIVEQPVFTHLNRVRLPRT